MLGLAGSTVLVLDLASFADASEGAYSAMDESESEPSDVMDGLPESLRTRNCETEVLIDEGPVEDSGEVGRTAAVVESIDWVGDRFASTDRSESMRLSILCRCDEK